MNFLDFVAFDVETTGLTTKDNEIIEIGLVKYRAGKLAEEYSSFLRPQKKISQYVVNMTGITNEMVATAPQFIEVADAIVSFIGEDLVLGHNISFDLGMLNSALEGIGKPKLNNECIDTLDLASILLVTERSYKLGHLAKHFAIEEDNVHRAKSDALMTSNLYLKFIDIIKGLPEETVSFIYYYISQTKWIVKEIFKDIFPSLVAEEYSWLLLLQAKEIRNQQKQETTTYPQLGIQDIFKVFKAGGFLSEKIKDYELRSSQMEMTEKVWDALKQSKHSVIEAVTGIGKSYAYTVPALFYSLNHRVPVVISTKTKNLQEQLFDKDIPLLAKAIGLHFKYIMIKGRENYVCINKLAYAFNKVLQSSNAEDMRGMISIMLWLKDSKSGDFSEIHSSITVKFKNLIHSDTFSCLQNKCPFKNICFINSIKKNAKDAQIVVVNHALLFTDVFYGSTTIPDYQQLIIDEAHTIEDVATGCFARTLGKKRIHDIAVKLVEQKNMDFTEKITSEFKLQLKELQNTARAMLEQNLTLFNNIEDIFKEKEKVNVFFKKSQKKINLTQLVEDEKKTIAETLQSLLFSMKEIHSKMDELGDGLKGNLSKIQYAFYKKIQLEIGFLIEDMKYLSTEKENHIRWLEKEEFKKTKFYELKVVPIDVGEYLQNYIFKQTKSVILTSATLAVKDNFNYFLSRIGYLESKEKVDCVSLSSPFDLEKNVLLCAPKDVPEYEDTKQYTEKIANYLYEILLTTTGKALVLFTSHKHLNEVFFNLKDRLAAHKITLFAQSKKSSDRNAIKMFRENINSVLMGTDSYWEGLDVPGKSLSHVIIVKLPFEVPTDPVVMARMEKVALQGKSSFFEYSIPKAVVKFKQGVGRLIRSKTDRGSIIILDRRVVTQGYGSSFLNSVTAQKKFPKDIKELKGLLRGWIE